MARGKPFLVGHAEIDTRPGARQDPAVALLMRAVDAGEVLLGPVLAELRQLRHLGSPASPDVMMQAIERVKERLGPPKPPAPPRLPRKPRTSSNRFGNIKNIGEVVYYMRVGNRVKIGTSANLDLRLKTINPEELMATEPGGTGHERHRHAQFQALRTHGEWFRLEGALAEHIEKLRAE